MVIKTIVVSKTSYFRTPEKIESDARDRIGLALTGQVKGPEIGH